MEGKVIEEKGVNTNLVKTERIQTVLKQLEGKQKQRPPIYSAIKIEERSYMSMQEKMKK